MKRQQQGDRRHIPPHAFAPAARTAAAAAAAGTAAAAAAGRAAAAAAAAGTATAAAAETARGIRGGPHPKRETETRKKSPDTE